ncbi:MAG: cytochrome c, partial [Bdellovibrionales bacterium]|nr:cytochrome c [Bdellovibrionales bacterium]
RNLSRVPLPHTVGRYQTVADPWRGTDPLSEGHELFGIYCAVCHGASGEGGGEVVVRGYPPTHDLRRPEVQSLDVREVEEIVRDGTRLSPAYRAQLSSAEITAVAEFVLRGLGDPARTG